MTTKTRTAKTKESKQLTLKDRLSRLTYYRACQLLGPDGPRLIRQGSTYDDIDIDHDVYLRGDLFRLKLPGAGAKGKRHRGDDYHHGRGEEPAAFQLHGMPDDLRARRRGRFVGVGRKDGAPVGPVAPDERRPLETLNEQELHDQALARSPGTGEDREVPPPFVRSRSNRGPTTPLPAPFRERPIAWRCAAKNEGSRSARVPTSARTRSARASTFSMCWSACGQRFPASARRKPYRNCETFVHVLYGEDVTLHLQLPDRPDPELTKAIGSLANGPIDDVRRLVDAIAKLDRLGRNVTVYPDAEELIQRRLFEQHMADRMAEIQRNPAKHPLRKQLLKVELLPYQLEGIAFAAGVGRAILADDMGLGKTIQGVGVAEILAPRSRHRPRIGCFAPRR